mgnify:FL=1
MGFNIGAVFAGAAQTISERVKEQEQRVNLLTDKALDLGTQVYLDKKKEAERDAKLLEEGMASLAMTGLDAATRFRIAQGGSTAVTNTLNQYNSFLEKDSDGDFTEFYSVKGSDAFADMTDQDFLAMYGPRAEYDPSIARRYLAGRGADGLGGLFVADPAKQLSEFEAKAGVLNESRVTDTPELGTLSIDMNAMQKVFGEEDKKLRFDTPKEAITYYTQAVLDEKAKEGGGDTAIITGFEGRIEAFKAIEAKDEEFSLTKRLDEIANEIYNLKQDDTKDNSAAITKLEGEKAGYLEHQAAVSAAGRAPDDPKTKTLDQLIDSVQIELSEAVLGNAPPERIEALQARETELLARKQKRVAATAADSGTASKDALTFPQATTNVKTRINLSLGSFDFVEVNTVSGTLDIKFGDGSENYPKFFAAMESVDSGIVRDSGPEGLNSNNLKQARGIVTDLLSTNARLYINKYKDEAANPTLNKSFNSLDEARAAARNGQLSIGTIVRYKQGNRTGIMVYTGGAVDDGFR